MDYQYSNSSSLGNGLEEIKFFSKDIDYDKELYESEILEKDKAKNDGPGYFSSGKPMNFEDFVKIWESGGPIKVLRLPDFGVYPLFFRNFQDLDYAQLKELLGNFFTLCEFENKDVRVTYRTEDDLRVGYQALKKDRRYHLRINFDLHYFKQNQKNYAKKNGISSSKNKRNQKLINQWINKGDVIIENSKYNCFPLQIKNYKELNYDELMELFSMYGKFTSIVQLENEYVQVKFCSEEAAQKCVSDLKKDSRYNVKLLFFLKELNKGKKLVKEVVGSKLDDHVMQLITDEDRIKFDPNLLPVRQSSVNQKHKKPKKLNTENSKVDMANVDNPEAVIYYKENCEHGNVYVKGTPFNNPYLTPPYSYKVWSNKKNHLPAPPPGDVYNNDANYEYCVKNMKLLGYHSYPCGNNDC